MKNIITINVVRDHHEAVHIVSCFSGLQRKTIFYSITIHFYEKRVKCSSDNTFLNDIIIVLVKQK